jgi:hypothetical protein
MRSSWSTADSAVRAGAGRLRAAQGGWARLASCSAEPRVPGRRQACGCSGASAMPAGPGCRARVQGLPPPGGCSGARTCSGHGACLLLIGAQQRAFEEVELVLHALVLVAHGPAGRRAGGEQGQMIMRRGPAPPDRAATSRRQQLGTPTASGAAAHLLCWPSLASAACSLLSSSWFWRCSSSSSALSSAASLLGGVRCGARTAGVAALSAGGGGRVLRCCSSRRERPRACRGCPPAAAAAPSCGARPWAGPLPCRVATGWRCCAARCRCGARSAGEGGRGILMGDASRRCTTRKAVDPGGRWAGRG